MCFMSDENTIAVEGGVWLTACAPPAAEIAFIVASIYCWRNFCWGLAISIGGLAGCWCCWYCWWGNISRGCDCLDSYETAGADVLGCGITWLYEALGPRNWTGAGAGWDSTADGKIGSGLEISSISVLISFWDEWAISCFIDSSPEKLVCSLSLYFPDLCLYFFL